MADRSVPPTQTPLAALPVAVLDLETTGLDVKQDRIVQIGVVELLGERLIDGARMDQLVHPDGPIPARSIAIHGITDADVASAPRVAEALAALQTAISGKIVVGHNVAFDLAVIRSEAGRVGIAWHDPPALDVAMLMGALQPGLPDLSLETIAGELGVTISRRHRALDDAQTAAAVFQRLLVRLREIDVRTLGEAFTFARRRSDLLVRQAEAGWHAGPGEAGPRPFEASMRVDSYVYQGRLADLMHSPAITASGSETLRAAAQTMVKRRIGALLIVDDENRPAGILTERDILRRVAEGLVLDEHAISTAMTSPVACMREEEMLYRALGRMDRLGVRHLCVVDGIGKAVGMVSQRDLLQHRARAAVELGDAIAQAQDVAHLAAAFARVSAVAGGLAREGSSGSAVARVVSSELRAVSARVAELAALAMAEDGHGAAPAPWCLVVLGSGGRGESLLIADQDNALIHLGGEKDAAWFAELGSRIATMLDQAGIPLCTGGVMASNPEWRGTPETWNARLEQWIGRARSEDLINVDIFFDLIPVAGDLRLARDLRQRAIDAATRSPAFLVRLSESVAGLASPVGLFGRLRAEEGRVDLKRSGLLHLVSLSRALALRAGSRARATSERLRDAAAAGRLSESDAERLIAAHEHLLSLVLRQQLADLADGVRLSSRVALSALSRAEHKALVAQLKSLDQMLGALRGAMAG